jgi:ATP-dependent Clp protease ATP-binding subunit ClpA
MNGSSPQSFFPEFTDHTPVFVGRQTEMAQLEEQLVDGDRRAVCITGMAGVGKTALAQAFGRRFAEVHGGNLISLAGTRELFTLDG